ncbi:MAG: alpha/beta fold hydrolase [Caulobacteraceae bacterium]|nr:alpha/beta fold hydrolase [Caulobacteraceae bacterium]
MTNQPVPLDRATARPPEPVSERLDSLLHAAESRAVGGLSPVAMGLAFFDFGVHLANAPFRGAALAWGAVQQGMRLSAAAADGDAITAPPSDHRFGDPAWREPPFHQISQAFLLGEEWWANAASGLPGVSRENQRIVSFVTRQLVDMASPSNIPWLNPEVIRATLASGGANFAAGFENFLTDLQETASGRPSGADVFRIGQDLAATPGKVVFRNTLIELIQYAPTTPEVAREPVLIVPAWIMKYYILDLSPQNSLIRYLVGQGHTVFAISWRNPDESFRDTTLDDYRTEGVMAALDVVGDICGDAKVQACGYCLGGTLLSIAAAAMIRDGDERLAGVTLFCAQTDFTDAGELQLFISEDQLAFLDDLMRAQGYLDSRQMSGAFQMLRSNDLIWSRLIKTYLMGEREHPNDLMAWNADGTRMPARMHGEYLRRLFLEDQLAEGRFPVEGRPVAISDIRAPMFVVGTETDHIAPWRSVHKIHLLTDAEVTFVLTSGGHNAGVVSEPGHPGRHFRIATRPLEGRYVGPDEWLASAEVHTGSWWPAWTDWLDARSTGRGAPPPVGSARYPAIEDAPGRYVLEH